MTELAALPVVGVCGYSGSGKTTLLVHLVPLLRRQGLSVLVVKHDAHGLEVDRPGKDTALLFAAGAEVLARDAVQSFARGHVGDDTSLASLVSRASAWHDVILVEGHKDVALPVKIWLRRTANDAPPSSVGRPALDLGRDENRLEQAERLVVAHLAATQRRLPLLGGIVLGGAPTPARGARSGRPGVRAPGLRAEQRRLRFGLTAAVRALAPLVERVLLLGDGAGGRSQPGLARLPTVSGHAGPVAAVLAALRWQPRARWLLLDCASPLASTAALRCLLAAARPGRWAILARAGADAPVAPFPCLLDGRLADPLEELGGLDALATHVRAQIVVVPVGRPHRVRTNSR